MAHQQGHVAVGLEIGEALDELGDQGVEIGRLLPHLTQQRLGRGQVRALKWSGGVDLRTRRARLLVARPERLEHGTVVDALGSACPAHRPDGLAIGLDDRRGQPKPREMKFSSTTASRRVLGGVNRETLNALPRAENLTRASMSQRSISRRGGPGSAAPGPCTGVAPGPVRRSRANRHGGHPSLGAWAHLGATV